MKLASKNNYGIWMKIFSLIYSPENLRVNDFTLFQYHSQVTEWQVSWNIDKGCRIIFNVLNSFNSFNSLFNQNGKEMGIKYFYILSFSFYCRVKRWGEQKRLTETDQKLWSRVFNVVCLSLFYLQSGHVEILQSRN